MKQYQIAPNELTLRVKKSPLIIRSFLFLFSFLFFIAPVSSIAFAIANGKGLHLKVFIFVFLFALFGIYMLRLALWNTYGMEKLVFTEDRLVYEADYGWFKGVKKELIGKEFTYLKESIVDSKDNLATLQILNEESNIQCVSKLPVSQIDDLIVELYALTFEDN